MPQSVVFYCPDRHILYDGRTPEVHGVGGGITTRVRMGRALADMGHEVTMVVNCPNPETIDGVNYIPLDKVARLDGDIVIFTTSGDRLDLTPALDLSVRAGIRIVWCHGVNQPKAINEIGADYVYVVSRFLGRIAREEWSIPEREIVVSYNGYDERLLLADQSTVVKKDPCRIIYFSHPSKGLGSALRVFQILHQRDGRFALDVYGSRALWGQPAKSYSRVPGVAFHGMVGQEALAMALKRASFSLQLQTMRESGALAIPEAQSAGCVIIGSPVGCYPEQIQNGANGYLIQGDPMSLDVQVHAADLVEALVHDPSRLDRVRVAASGSAVSVQSVARSWTRLWETQHSFDEVEAEAGVMRLVSAGGATDLGNHVP